MNTVRDTYYFVEDLMTLLGLSRSKCYKIIKQLNEELEEQGETFFLAREGITTMEQLEDRKVAIKSEIEALTVQRQELRKFTRKGDQQAISEVRGQIGQLSQQLKKLRKEVILCEGIALRSGRVKENLGQLLVVKREKAQFYRRGANLPIIDRS